MREPSDVEVNSAVRQQNMRPAMIELTPEEKRVIEQCKHDSFWQRGAPIGFGSAVFLEMLQRRGVVRPIARLGMLGTLPKSIAAGMIGTMLGRLSYVSTCQARILQLENSPLADRIRRSQRRTGVVEEMSPVSPHEANKTRVAKLSDEYRAHDIETGQAHHTQGLDDSKRPTVDWDQGVKGQVSTSPPPNVSYEDLRKQNRQQFELKPPPPPAPNTPTPPPPPSSQASQKRVKRNQYGDIIE